MAGQRIALMVTHRRGCGGQWDRGVQGTGSLPSLSSAVLDFGSGVLSVFRRERGAATMAVYEVEVGMRPLDDPTSDFMVEAVTTRLDRELPDGRVTEVVVPI
eukprot:903113-Alexandrium_andersonii.AAC.1